MTKMTLFYFVSTSAIVKFENLNCSVNDLNRFYFSACIIQVKEFKDLSEGRDSFLLFCAGKFSSFGDKEFGWLPTYVHIIKFTKRQGLLFCHRVRKASRVGGCCQGLSCGESSLPRHNLFGPYLNFTLAEELMLIWTFWQAFHTHIYHVTPLVEIISCLVTCYF